ncbi:MAG TPA: response regulator [Candidatus Saccharimonadia bacterium]|nr:response regulator [Candidatus Saccharimonadia bacterium]
MNAGNRPRVLVVDDDPVCLRFVRDALEAEGYRVESVATLGAARRALVAGRYACLVCDLELPDGAGTAIVDDALGAHTPAVAISAEIAAARRGALLRAGFAAALEKPLRAAALVAALDAVASGVTHALPADSVRPARGDALLDDEAALAVGGAPAVVDGLRALLRDELAPGAASIEAALARGDRDAARAVLHRLRAACGFCGAHRLLAAAEALASALAEGCDNADAQRHFSAALEATRAALVAATATRATATAPA